MIAQDEGAARGPLRAATSTRRAFAGARTLVVAHSGGGDSTALLLLVSEWARPRGVAIVSAHVAHGLRGAAGDEDARFCARLAASLSLPFAFRPVDVPSGRKKGESLEAAARRLRYAALLALSHDLEDAPVLTGHTRDDQAETVLLHLERRLGRGRGGIRARRDDGVIRPLLPFSRAELRQFLEERGVSFREDETNENEGFARNRIRRTVLPEMERKDPGRSSGSRAREPDGVKGWTRSTGGSTRRWRKRGFLRMVSGPVPSSRASRLKKLVACSCGRQARAAESPERPR